VPLSTPELSAVTSVTNEAIADIVAKEVGSIGENLRATRAIYMSVDSPHSRLANYIHTAGRLSEQVGSRSSFYDVGMLKLGGASQFSIKFDISCRKFCY